MAKPKRINLNDYIRVNTLEDVDGKFGLILRLQNPPDGTSLPETYWVKKPDTGDFFFVEDTENAVWHKEIRISNSGSKEEYGKRVQWWIEKAFNDDEFKEIIYSTFNVYGYDIDKATKVAVAKLIDIPTNQFYKRKTYMKKHMYDWWTKGVNWARKRQEKNTNDI